MIYVKRDINESIDEYVMDERDILELIERVLGDEFRREVEVVVSNKNRILELERDIAYGDEQYDILESQLEDVSESLDCANDEINDLKERIDELKDEVKEYKNRLKEG